MALLPAIAAADVAAVEVIQQRVGPAAEPIVAGQVVRYDTTNGRWTLANATAAAEARVAGVAIKSATQAGDTITVVRKGVLDVGDALDTQTYDDDVFLSRTDGRIDDVVDATAGTVSVVVGTVIPAWGGATPDKLLSVDL